MKSLNNRLSAMLYLSAFLFLVLGSMFACTVLMPAMAEENEPAFWNVEGHYDFNTRQDFVYGDSMLLTDASKGVSPEMAKVSVSLAAAAYNPGQINDMLKGMGFSHDNYQFSKRTIHENDLVAFTIGEKKIGDKTAFIVAIRGSSENAEWFSNFNVGASESGDHKGFHEASTNVLLTLINRMGDVPEEDRIILVTGHSRGGAVANIVAAHLTKHQFAPQSQIFGYTFACPNVSKNVKAYPNIFNFNNNGDMVTAIPLEAWGYGRHGTTIQISAPLKAFQNHHGREYTGAGTTYHYEQAFKQLAATPELLEDASRQFLVMLLAYNMGGNADVTQQELIIKYAVDNGLQIAGKILKDITGISDIEDVIDNSIKLYENYHGIILQMQKDTKDMTPEEFDEYRENNKAFFDEIMGATGVLINSVGDFPIVIEVLLDSIQYADEWGTMAGAFYVQFESTDGHLMQGILDAHLEPVYVLWVNQEYYGYRGRIFDSRNARIPDDVLTLGPECFYKSEIVSFSANQLHYIASGCFSECEKLETVVIPNTVTSIGSYAFARCSGMKTITLPIEQSGFGLFWQSYSVETIYYTAQSNGVMPQRVMSPYMVDNRYDNTLEYACHQNVKKIVYGEGVTEIADYANYHNYGSQLEEVILPSTIKRIGDYAFYQCAMPSINLPEGLEKIGASAFNGSGLTSIRIPASAKTQGSYAFANSTKLKEILLDCSVVGEGCFAHCTGLEILVIPNTVTQIGQEAFSNCTGLKTVTLPIEQSGFSIFWACYAVESIHYTAQSNGVMPVRVRSPYLEADRYDYTLEYACHQSVKKIVYGEGVTEIADYANYHHYSSQLEEVILPSTLKRIGDYAFYQCAMPAITLPQGLEEVGASAFNRSGLTAIRLPASIQTLGDYAFSECTALKEILLDNSMIGMGCFAHCTGLETLVIPNTVTQIGKYAFDNCSGLKNITLPIEQSGFNIFWSCWQVERICYTAQSNGVMPRRVLSPNYGDDRYDYTLEYACHNSVKEIIYSEGVTEIADYANYNGGWGQSAEISLPSTLKRIGQYAFYKCGDTCVELPETLEEVGEHAFAEAKLTSVSIPSAVTKMGDYAFGYCYELKELSLNGSAIGGYAFVNCIALEELVIPNAVTSIGEGAFVGCGMRRITLPIEQSGFKIFTDCGAVETIEYTAQSNGVMPARVQTSNYGDPRYDYTLEYACRQNVKKIIYGEGVTEIADYANYHNGFTMLSEVHLPSTLKKIGQYAFYYCQKLTTLRIGPNVEFIADTAFEGSIYGRLFIVDPGSAAEEFCIEHNYAYTAPSDFEILLMDSGAIVIVGYHGQDAFVTIPDGFGGYPVTDIGENAFKGYGDLLCIRIPDGILHIDDTAFDQPTLVVLCNPDTCAASWAQSKGYTVSHCCEAPEPAVVEGVAPTCVLPGLSQGLRCAHCNTVLAEGKETPALGHTVVLAQSVYEMKQGESVVISFTPSCGGVCGVDAYWAWTAVEEGTAAENGCATCTADTPGAIPVLLWMGEDKEKAASCTLIVHSDDPMMLPRALKELGDSAFAGMAAQEVVLPAGVTSIGEHAFAQCHQLVLVTIPDTVLSIADSAFEGSTNVTILCSEDSQAAAYANRMGVEHIAR